MAQQPVVEAPLHKLQRLRELQARLAALDALQPRPWHSEARPEQIPPSAGDWMVYAYVAGRGAGKTRSGAEWIAEQAVIHPGTEWAIVAPTWRDCRKVCVEGSSGLLRAFRTGEMEGYNASDLQIRLTNGSKIYGYSGDKIDRLRGSNLSGAWVDELAAMPHARALWDEALMPALRIGDRPRVFVTTTPRPVPLLRDLLAREDGSVIVVRGSTWSNAANLSKAALAELQARYLGTRLGRQELEGELIEDVDGALWNRLLIEETRVLTAPDLVRVVVGVDPAVTSGEHADHTGIVVAGRARDGQIYVLADYSMRGSPRACMSRAVKAYQTHRADRIIGEVNNGGDYIEGVLRTVDENVPYATVRATRGKYVRAEPVSAMFEQRRAHIVGVMPELEDEMCSFVPDSGDSPDRLDAAVWAATELNTGASALSYLAQISVECKTCRLPNPVAADMCRSCGAPIDAADVA